MTHHRTIEAIDDALLGLYAPDAAPSEVRHRLLEVKHAVAGAAAAMDAAHRALKAGNTALALARLGTARRQLKDPTNPEIFG